MEAMWVLSYMIIESFFISIIVGFILGLLSFFVISRNVEFAGVGISHALFGGVAIALVLGADPQFILPLFAVVIALVIVRYSDELSYNTSIGILFPFSIALGIILLQMFYRNLTDVWSYLFGNIFIMSNIEKLSIVFYAILLLAYITMNFEKLVMISIDGEFAKAYGVNVVLQNYMFYIILSLGIAVVVKSVGIILMSAMLVLPSAISFKIANGLLKSATFSVVFSILLMLFGTGLSFVLNTPSGATTILLGGLTYYMLSLWKS